MTDDLVEKLREEAKWGNPHSSEVLKLIEALERENNDMAIHFDGLVARIEKLEAALVKIGVWNNFEDRYQGTINELIHNALEGKDE